MYRPLWFHECSQDFIGAHDETRSVSHARRQFRWFALQDRELRASPNSNRSIDLKQSEQFEDNDDHDDYSNDIEDVPVHARDSYQAKCVVASIYPRYMIP